MFSAGALFPLEVIKTNLQAHTKQKKSTSSSSPPSSAEKEDEPVGGGESRDSAATSAPGEGDGVAGSRVVEGMEEGQQHQQRRLVALAQQNDPQQQKQQGRDARELGGGRSSSAPSVVSVAKDIYSREGLAGLYRGKDNSLEGTAKASCFTVMCCVRVGA